jgi:hypothetical protein
MARRPVESFTGRAICDDCQARTAGLAAGVVSGTGGADVGNAVAVAGWYRRLRARLRARR